jgi:riboflavin synthase
VDGVFLTVNVLPERKRARVALVPFTLQHTTLAGLHVGDAVHLEADIIGRYVQALLHARS